MIQSTLFEQPTLPRFDGAHYDEKLDRERLTKQLDKVRHIMLSGEWMSLSKIHAFAGGSEAATSSRIRDLRKSKFGGHTIESRRVKDGYWEYRLVK